MAAVKSDGRVFELSIEGISPLILHADDVNHSDRVTEWRKSPENKTKLEPGSDRTPAWTWIGYLYGNGTHICVPQMMLAAAVRQAATDFALKGNKSFKAESVSGILLVEPSWPVLVDGKPISVESLDKLYGSKLDQKNDLPKHCELANSLGIHLRVERVPVGTAKHIRVRPEFAKWSLKGHVQILSSEISDQMLADILSRAGSHKGIGDFRLSSKRTPGPFGRFSVSLKAV